MNHKRKKPKSSRAGCLMCKPHKHQRVSKTKRASDKGRLLRDLQNIVDSFEEELEETLQRYRDRDYDTWDPTWR